MNKKRIGDTLRGIAQLGLSVGAIVVICAVSYVTGANIIENAERILPNLHIK